jgi:hypothetical protein
MKQQIIALAAIGLVAAMGPAQAAGPRWVQVGNGAGGGPIEVDRASLTWHSVQHAVWRIPYATPKPNGAVEERHVELIDCDAHMSAPISTTSIGPNGNVIDVQSDPENIARQHLGPPTIGSPGRRVAVGACQLRPPPPKRHP